MNMKNTFHIVEAIERQLADKKYCAIKFAISHELRQLHVISEDESASPWSHAVHSYYWDAECEEVHPEELLQQALFTSKNDALACWDHYARPLLSRREEG